jgi:hypothetical protein
MSHPVPASGVAASVAASDLTPESFAWLEPASLDVESPGRLESEPVSTWVLASAARL